MNPPMRLKKPAIEGGKPVRRKFLPFGPAVPGRKSEQLVMDVLKSGNLVHGEIIEKLEINLKEYLGTPAVIALNSFSATFQIALETAGIGQGHEVITSPFSFSTACNSILNQHATPVFVDIEPKGLTLDPSLIEEYVTPATKAIIPNHFAGYPANMNKLQIIADRFGLVIIENAADAMGATYRGGRIGSISDFTCFYLHSCCSSTGGYGGILSTIHADQENRMRTLGRQGFAPEDWKNYEKYGLPPTDMKLPGYHYSPSDLDAAVAFAHTEKIETAKEKRRLLWKEYDKLLKDIPAVKTPFRVSRKGHSCSRYVIQIDTDRLRVDRDTVVKAMIAENIGVAVHFKSLHLQHYFRERLGYGPGMMPVAEEVSSKVMSLPLRDDLTFHQVTQVAEALHRIINYYLN